MGHKGVAVRKGGGSQSRKKKKVTLDEDDHGRCTAEGLKLIRGKGNQKSAAVRGGTRLLVFRGVGKVCAEGSEPQKEINLLGANEVNGF